MRCDKVLNIIDIGPTLIDLAGATQLPDADGRSFAHLLTDREGHWSNETFSEMRPYLDIPPRRMIRRGPWKLVHTHGRPPALFNIDDDPREMRDLAEEPECAAVRRELTERVTQDWPVELMMDIVEERDRVKEFFRAWNDRVGGPSEQWIPPPNANAYPL